MNSKYIKKNNLWQLIIIEDSDALPGKSVFDLLKVLMKQFKFKYVILNDIEGAAEAANDLKEKEGEIISIDEFLEKVVDVIQFDWGDFFLFLDYPKNWEFVDRSYSKQIEQTDMTVRAIDDQYLYIYTPSQDVLGLLKEYYTIESLKSDLLENLDFPY